MAVGPWVGSAVRPLLGVVLRSSVGVKEGGDVVGTTVWA